MKKSKFSILFAGIITLVIVGVTLVVVFTVNFDFISDLCDYNSLDIYVASDFEMNIYLDTEDERYDTIELFDDYHNITDEYAYDLPLDDKGSPLVNMADTEAFYIKPLYEKIFIITFKHDGMHSFKLEEHVLDQLVFLNDETKCAEVLFEAEKGNRILYGNMNFVIIYNYKENIAQYISVSDGNVFKEASLNLREDYSYIFRIENSKNIIEISGYSTSINFDLFNSELYEHSLSIPIH